MNCKTLKFFIATVLLLMFTRHSFAQDPTDAQPDTTYISSDEDSTGNLVDIPDDTVIVKTAFDNGRHIVLTNAHQIQKLIES